MIIREIVVEPQAIAWLPWAVSYFFFIGLSFSAVFAGLIINRAEKNPRHEFIAIALALSCAIVAPVALIADLHQPARVINFYLNPTPWSWMAWGAFFLPLFIIAVAGYFLCLLRQVIVRQNLPKVFGLLYRGKFNMLRWTSVFRLLSLLSALSVLVYTAMEMFVVEARPLWHHYWLMPLILFSALPAALLLYRLFAEALDKHPVPAYFSHLIVFSLMIFAGIPAGLFFSSKLTALQLHQLWGFSKLPMLTLVCLGVLILLSYLPRSLRINMLAAFIALGLSWLVRWILLIQVQSIGKYNALMNPFYLTWHVDGAIGLLSVFGLWIFIGTALWQLFNNALSQINFSGGKYE